MSIPRKLRNWLAMISTAAPAVKPTTTVCEMKFTSAPRRARPMASMITPAMRERVRTSPTYCGDPGTARGATVAKTTSDTALVGPVTAWRDEPQSAATIVGTIAP